MSDEPKKDTAPPQQPAPISMMVDPTNKLVEKVGRHAKESAIAEQLADNLLERLTAVTAENARLRTRLALLGETLDTPEAQGGTSAASAS